MSEPEHAEQTERQCYCLNHIRACGAAVQTSVEYARAQGIKVKSVSALISAPIFVPSI